MTLLSDQLHLHPDQLDAYWMPFTANRQFKSAPRMVARAEGMHYWTPEGRKILDGFSGLWCCNAGHNRKPIVEAIQKQAATMDYAPAFQMGQPLAFELGQPHRGNRPEGHEPRLLLQFGFGGGGHRAQDRACLPPREGRGRPHAPHRPRARLPRRGVRRHLGGRHGRQPQDVRRDARGRRPSAAHAQPRKERLHARRAGVGRSPRRRARAARAAPRRLDDRRRDRGADGGLNGRAGSPEGLPQAASRDHEEARHPAHLRRGDQRASGAWAAASPPGSTASSRT